MVWGPEVWIPSIPLWKGLLGVSQNPEPLFEFPAPNKNPKKAKPTFGLRSLEEPPIRKVPGEMSTVCKCLAKAKRYMQPWKLRWLAGKSPCSIGNTSSHGGVSIVMLFFFGYAKTLGSVRICSRSILINAWSGRTSACLTEQCFVQEWNAVHLKAVFLATLLATVQVAVPFKLHVVISLLSQLQVDLLFGMVLLS